MTQNPDEFAPDGERGGEDPEVPAVPDDAASLVGDSAADAPSEGSAEERAADAAASGGDRVAALEAELSERTADLQRLQAEYVNYKRRVDRDRDVARQSGVEQVVNDLLPVLDAIDAARQHEEIDGGFKLVVDALENVTGKYGLVAYGEVGEEFDPHLHEALMQMPLEGDHETPVIAAVMQKGIRLGERIVRPARVGVAEPN